jgi:hypothetical protein
MLRSVAPAKTKKHCVGFIFDKQAGSTDAKATSAGITNPLDWASGLSMHGAQAVSQQLETVCMHVKMHPRASR